MCILYLQPMACHFRKNQLLILFNKGREIILPCWRRRRNVSVEKKITKMDLTLYNNMKGTPGGMQTKSLPPLLPWFTVHDAIHMMSGQTEKKSANQLKLIPPTRFRSLVLICYANSSDHIFICCPKNPTLNLSG